MMPQKGGKATAKKTLVSRAKKDELLLATCEPIMSAYAMEHLAASLHGMMLTAPDGQIFQVVAVRVDEQARQIYGKCQEMIEAAPYMFASASSVNEQEKPQKTLQVELYLWVENNSKFVRGKSKARAQIEALILSQYAMEKHPSSCEYTLTISYDTDEELERIICDEILREADRLADMRYCFIEADVRALDGSDRHW
jgi:hypothetical protein